MTDLWIDIIFTVIVTVLTILADWLSSRFIAMTRGLRAIEQAAAAAAIPGGNTEDQMARIRDTLEAYRRLQSSYVTWGSDLAGIAFSLDLAVLLLWQVTPNLLPFFSRWNTTGAPRELAVWTILLLAHFLMLLLSILFKHLHVSEQTIVTEAPAGGWPPFRWLQSRRFVLVCNTLGFISLLTSFVVTTNAL